MNLRQLRYFLAIAEELHFSRAAKRLNMAQPPLSAQIKQLETDLGVLLFERTKRRVTLTAAGAVLKKEAEQVLQRVETARQKTQQAGRGEIGQLTIAFVSSAMYSILPDWLRAFRQHYPAVSLTLQEATTTEQIEGLLSHQLDIGFVRPPISHNKLASKTVWQEPLLVALPANHRLSTQTSAAAHSHSQLSISDLSEEDFILTFRPHASELYDKIMDFCAQAHFSPRVVQTAEQLQTVLGLVAAQLGIAILPAAAQKLQREGVCYRTFAEVTPTAQLMMIWRKSENVTLLKNFQAVEPCKQKNS